ncbi:ATP-binding protein [Syntrophothermus sp.]|uniref:ATP-binding protein n=1 Tax=Syntrophothermus sp. TaxID=2736299 RepID=UPI00338EED49
MSQANMERIFDPFFSTYPHKAGLGLTVCQQILRSCRGTISIKSKEGLGTVVKVTLLQS